MARHKKLVTDNELRVLKALGESAPYGMAACTLSKKVDPHSELWKVVSGMEGTHASWRIDADIEAVRRIEDPRHRRNKKEVLAERRKKGNKAMDGRNSVSGSVHRALKGLFDKKLAKRLRHHDNDYPGDVWYNIGLTEAGRALLEDMQQWEAKKNSSSR